jgi:hypothetical protein
MDFSLLHSIKTSSEMYPASYPMDNEDSFPRGKAAMFNHYLHLMPNMRMHEVVSPLSIHRNDVVLY